jgi:hypothetical protein
MTLEEVLERWERVIVKVVESLEEEWIRNEKERFFYLVGSPPLPSEEPRRLSLFLEYLVLEVPIQDRMTPMDLFLRGACSDSEVMADAERFHRSYLAIGKVKKVRESELELQLFPQGEHLTARLSSTEGVSTGAILITRILPFSKENYLPSTTEILEPRHRHLYLKFLKSLPPEIPLLELWLATLLWNHLVRQFPAARGDDLFHWFSTRLKERKLLFAQVS